MNRKEPQPLRKMLNGKVPKPAMPSPSPPPKAISWYENQPLVNAQKISDSII